MRRGSRSRGRLGDRHPALRQPELATHDDRWADLNTQFHAAIYSIVPNAQLLALIEMLRNRAEVYVRILARQDVAARNADDTHEQMLAALRRNDPDTMESLVRAHLRATVNAVAPLLTAADAAAESTAAQPEAPSPARTSSSSA